MADNTRPPGFHPPPPTDLVPIDDGLLTRAGRGDAEMFRVSVEVARRYPRDEGKIVKHLLDTLDVFPQFANKAIYSIKYNQGKPNESKVEGLTIRAAETIAASWGNLLIRAEILGEDDNGWDLQAGVFDMQSNYRWVEPARASKWEKRRDGRVELLDDRRQLQMRGSAVSKVTRNAILRILPLHVKAAFELRVREKMAGGDLTKPADKARVAAAIEAFEAAFKVTEAQLVTYVGKPRDVWVGDDLADLRGLYNALEAGETTVAEAFAAEAPPVTPVVPAGTTTKVEEGTLGSAAPAPPPTPAPAPAPPVEETRAARLRRELAEAEAAERAAVPVTDPAKEAADWAAKARQDAKAAASAKPVAQPVAVPPPSAPTAAPATDLVDDSMAALAAEVTAALDIKTLDAILGRMYAPGGGLVGATRERKRAILAIIGARRDKLQAEATAT